MIGIVILSAVLATVIAHIIIMIPHLDDVPVNPLKIAKDLLNPGGVALILGLTVIISIILSN
jgi:hypothetical protein